MNNSRVSLVELLISIFLATFGGIVNKLADKEKSPRKKILIGAYVSSAIISMFVGAVTYAFCKHYGVPPFMTVAATALGGCMGFPAIYILYRVAAKRQIGGSDDDGEGKQ